MYEPSGIRFDTKVTYHKSEGKIMLLRSILNQKSFILYWYLNHIYNCITKNVRNKLG